MSSTVEILRKKNEAYARFQNFRQFHEFALHYESAELAESLERFTLLTNKKLDYFLSDLKLIFNLQNQQKVELRKCFT